MNNHFLPSELFSIAPMIDYTDTYFRQFARLFTKYAALYTPMIAADAIYHNKLSLLEYEPIEHPLFLQLGGCDEKKLAYACKIANNLGYDGINLNAGCPSDRVQNGSFGAILMKDRVHLASLFDAMAQSSDVPVSVKTRIGVDNEDSYEFTYELINALYQQGCRHIILHARKAWLNGLSPKENRTIPPLDYQRVYKIKQEFSDLNITINGGIVSLENIKEQLQKVDGVMLGRAIIDNPYLLAYVDKYVFDKDSAIVSYDEIIEKIIKLCERLEKQNIPVNKVLRHALGLFYGQKNSKIYRRYLSENMNKLGAKATIIEEAYKLMQSTHV